VKNQNSLLLLLLLGVIGISGQMWWDLSRCDKSSAAQSGADEVTLSSEFVVPPSLRGRNRRNATISTTVLSLIPIYIPFD
jgi:hypothetical protein